MMSVGNGFEDEMYGRFRDVVLVIFPSCDFSITDILMIFRLLFIMRYFA